MSEPFPIQISELAEWCESLASSVRIAANKTGFRLDGETITDFEIETPKSARFHRHLAKLPDNEAERILFDLRRQGERA